MAATSENWIYDKNTVREKDIKALEKAKSIERKKIKDGYRYFKICDKMQMLLPCDRNGNPTDRAIKVINERKRMYGLK